VKRPEPNAASVTPISGGRPKPREHAVEHEDQIHITSDSAVAIHRLDPLPAPRAVATSRMRRSSLRPVSLRPRWSLLARTQTSARADCRRQHHQDDREREQHQRARNGHAGAASERISQPQRRARDAERERREIEQARPPAPRSPSAFGTPLVALRYMTSVSSPVFAGSTYAGDAAETASITAELGRCSRGSSTRKRCERTTR
jgi:hypothetical protein